MTGSSVRFVQKDLFGGAIKVNLPENFFDTSQIREVPDHQEVYLDRDGFSSIMFDILERVAEVPTDEAALLYHLFDIMDAGDKFCITNPTTIDLAHHLTPAYSLTACNKPTSNKSGGWDYTVVMLLLIRLEMQETDILISINLPFRGRPIPGDGIDLSSMMDTGMVDDTFELGSETIKAIAQSFEIQDWGLFGE